MSSVRRPRPAALCAVLAAGSLALSAAPAAAIAGGTPVADSDTTHAYTAQITIGAHDRGCSAVLVDAEWLLTAASCFAEDPAASLAVPAGVPAETTTAVIGRSDLSGTQGAERRVVEIVPRTDRDVVLARLNRPVANVAPARLATTAPSAGAELVFAGYGRTKTAWAPLKLHTGTYGVDSTAATSAGVTGKNGSAACMGDAGGPVISGGRLVGLNSQSFQGGCLGIDETQTSTAGVIARVDDLASWIDEKAGATRIADFNGDGIEDIAIGDPMATVGGVTTAGLVRVLHGGGKGTAEITQDLDWVPGGAEAGDHFGKQLATVDYNEDGYTDLVVSAPEENVGSAVDAGFVDILFGGRNGLGSGPAARHLEQGSGNGSLGGSAPEDGDRMGASLAAGTTAEGKPWILIGTPGEALGSLTEAGGAFYVHGDTSIVIHQDTSNVPGAAEANDAFGTSVTGDSGFIAIGAPGDAIGGDANAGNLAVLSHELDADGRPTVVTGMDQDDEQISGGAEAGDQFGQALALVAYRPSAAATATDSILAIGAPGEALAPESGAGQLAGAGNVMLVHIRANGTWDYMHALNQGSGTDDRSGTIEAGDHVGSSLSAVNTAPRKAGSAATLKIAVGAPGEDLAGVTDAGAIHTFSLMDAAGANDRWIEAGDGDGIPGSPGEGDKLGASIHFTPRNLYAGMPYGPAATGALHVLPFPNVVPGGTSGPATTYQPGQDGLPANGNRFGYSAR
ncbi:trypsin-like serine protease [Streptomyces sp. F63]|uniref:trypsin-like serine protease n=1 Tax=Streptomyces sp. F63 TaxID=2824887 RepID=UPI001B38EF1B|nr:trypsin-like serine protease [Streptomyces sp. F63]MBQ0986497.1 trypsin-like serine protease [Streptomyces sp. F63]